MVHLFLGFFLKISELTRNAVRKMVIIFGRMSAPQTFQNGGLLATHAGWHLYTYLHSTLHLGHYSLAFSRLSAMPMASSVRIFAKIAPCERRHRKAQLRPVLFSVSGAHFNSTGGGCV